MQHFPNFMAKLPLFPLNDEYTTGNLWVYFYYQKCYKLIGIDLSRQINISIAQQFKFTGKLGEDDGATMFFITKRQQKTILNICLLLLLLTD